MAGDWLKIETSTPDKPEVLRLAALLGITPDDAFGKCFRFWRWADSQTVDGVLRGVTCDTIDALIHCRKFADSLSEVGWLATKRGALCIPDFGKHMSESAKRRALTARRVTKHRRNKRNSGVTLTALAREEESKRREEENYGQPDDQSRMTINAGGEERLGISAQQWDRILSMAEAVARKIPPTNTKGRRCWFKYAALAELKFGESWLMDAVEGVRQSKETRRSPQAHFVGILIRNAESKFSVDRAGFSALMNRIEVPQHIWQSGHLEVA